MATTKPIPKFSEADQARFWSFVQKSDGCWQWTGAISRRKGYGSFRFFYAHRIAYALMRGAIPDGLHIDHVCRNTGCVNPDHLEAVTSRENTLRGKGLSALAARRTHCSAGHLMSGENVRAYTHTKNGRQYRVCLRCSREYAARRRARRNSGDR